MGNVHLHCLHHVFIVCMHYITICSFIKTVNNDCYCCLQDILWEVVTTFSYFSLTNQIPYSGKLLREKTFANFAFFFVIRMNEIWEHGVVSFGVT